MKKSIQLFLITTLFVFTALNGLAQQKQGDTISLGGTKYKLLSNNLIANPGFEDGFVGWTDATTSAATLTTAKFSINSTGGISNSKYLIGLTNENSSSSGSIGTGWPITSGKSYIFAFQVKYLNASTAAGSELYLKISRTNDKTSSAEPGVLINTSTVNGAGTWTQNFVYFVNTNPVYNYVQARFRWLGNRLGFDDFMLYEAIEVVNVEALQAVINEANNIYNPSAKGASELLTAINVAQGFLSSTSSVDVTTAITNLQKAIQTYKYANASPANPLDMTSYINNPGFDANVTTGWEGAGTVNYHEVEFYQKVFDMYQVISGLPAGKYRLKAKGFERPKLNDSGTAYKSGTEIISARLYAASSGFTEVNVPFNSLYKHNYTGTGALNGYVNTMAAAEIMISNTSISYYDMTLSNIFLNEGQKLTIGAKTTSQQSGYWALIDNFKLEYLGTIEINDLVVAVTNRIAECQKLLSEWIQNSAVIELNTAILKAQMATTAEPLVQSDIEISKTTIDEAITKAYTSLNAYSALQKAINDANLILTFLDKTEEISKLQNAIISATQSYNNRDLTLNEINLAKSTLVTITRSVGKQIYNPSWMMGDIYNSSNNWSIERSKQSKNWILFWEPGFGDNPGTIVDDCLNLAEKCFYFYTDSLKFIQPGSSKTDNYKMIIRLRYSSDWEATGSGVDNTIGLLTLTSWALTSRGGQTIAHEVGHCFQYQTHCDNNNMNGWMYGFGANASGSNGWWEQCAQWQAYKIFPTQQFTNEWFTGYLNNVHKHLLHEAPRYNNYFIQDYWTNLHGKDFIGRLWNKSYSPEDPVETYKRLNVITQAKFNDEMWDCAAKFTTWDIPSLTSLGANYIISRPQPKMNNIGNYVWRVDSTVCIENYGHNIIKLNAPTTAKTVTVYFEGLAGSNGYRKLYVSTAGWRYGFVALLKNGTRVYGDAKQANMIENGGKSNLSFDCPANCDKLWLVVSGAPSVHWRHAWDDDDTNDEQWPYQVSFNNSNLYGYQNVVNGIEPDFASDILIYTSDGEIKIRHLPINAEVNIFNITGVCVLNAKPENDAFSATLPEGIYIVNIYNREGNYSRKVVVE